MAGDNATNASLVFFFFEYASSSGGGENGSASAGASSSWRSPTGNGSGTGTRTTSHLVPLEEWRDSNVTCPACSEYWEYPSGYSQLRIILTSFFVTCIMILIVVGNMLVCIAIATEKALKTIQNWFIASLAVSDFLLGLVIMPFSLANELMGYWIFGPIWCEIHSALDVLLCTASINNLCLISLDRYWSVTQAVEYLKKRTQSRAIFMICFVWALSALISLPPLVGWKKAANSADYPVCSLSDDIGYVMYSALGSFYIPAIVMVFVYIRIFIAARSRARRHVKKPRLHAPNELTNDPIRDKSTTTTTCTSFSNPSPPDALGKEGDSTAQCCDTPTESNAPTVRCLRDSKVPSETDFSGGSLPTPTGHSAPQIVIQTPYESPVLRQSGEGSKRRLEQRTVDQNGCGGQGGDPGDEHLRPLMRDSHSRPALLSTPRLSKTSAYGGSTMSLADYDRNGEPSDESEGTRRGGRNHKKGGKVVQYACEPLPCRHSPSDAERHKRKVAKARERRATLILGLIMATFILAWLPFFVLYVLDALCASCRISDDKAGAGFAVAFWLGYCNSALNPIIYTIFNRDFRRAFRKILFK